MKNKAFNVYVIAFLKIALALVISAIWFFKNSIFNTAFQFPKFIEVSIIVVILYLDVRLIAGSIADLVSEFEKREETRKSQLVVDGSECEARPLDNVISLVKQNDIIEIEIKAHNGLIKIGSSSQSNELSSKLFDKRYYIGKVEYTDIDGFCNEVQSLLSCDVVYVYAIDGIRTKHKVKRGRKSKRLQ